MQAMATETFIGNMRGPVIRRTDVDYDAVRSLYNGMIDKKSRDDCAMHRRR